MLHSYKYQVPSNPQHISHTTTQATSSLDFICIMDFILNPGIAILGFNLSNEKDCCEAIQGIEIVQFITWY